MNRYITSFIITFILYLLLLSVMLYSLNHNNLIISKNKKTKTIKFSIINIPKKKIEKNKKSSKYEEKVSQKIVEKTEDKIKKRVETTTFDTKKVLALKDIPTKTLKTSIKKISKKITKKRTKHKKTKKKSIKKYAKKSLNKKKFTPKKRIKKKYISKNKQNHKKHTYSKNSSFSLKSNKPTISSSISKEEFLTKLIQKINASKVYPRTAIRRGVSADIEVSFTIMPDGSVKNITVNGNSIFFNSSKNAVMNAFPIDVSNSPHSLPWRVSITIRYKIVS